MKKLISLLCVFALIISFVPAFALADDGELLMSISATDGAGNACAADVLSSGDIVEVTLRLKAGLVLSSVETRLIFDETKFELLDESDYGSAVAGWSSSLSPAVEAANNSGSLPLLSTYGEPNDTTTVEASADVYFTAVFKVICTEVTDAASGRAEFSLDEEDTELIGAVPSSPLSITHPAPVEAIVLLAVDTATLSGLTYSGNAVTAGTAESGANIIYSFSGGGLVIVNWYFDNNGNAGNPLATNTINGPVDAGTYWIGVSFSGKAEALWQFTIASPAPSIIIAEGQSKAYDGSSITGGRTGSGADITYTYTGSETEAIAWYSDNDGPDASIASPTDVGTYWISVSASDVSGGAPVYRQFSITKSTEPKNVTLTATLKYDNTGIYTVDLDKAAGDPYYGDAVSGLGVPPEALPNFIKLASGSGACYYIQYYLDYASVSDCGIYTFTFPVSLKNWAASTVTFILTVTDKDEVDIEYTNTGYSGSGSPGAPYTKTYDASAFTYSNGSSITINATLGGGAVSVSSYQYSWYAADGDTPLGSAPTEAGEYYMLVSVDETDTSYTGTAAVYFTIEPKQITANVAPVVETSKPYSGTATAKVTSLGAISGFQDSDLGFITFTINAVYDSASVGTGKTITVSYTLGGVKAGNYIAPAGYVYTTSGEITTKAVALPTANVVGIADGVGSGGLSFTLTAPADTLGIVSYTAELWLNSDDTLVYTFEGLGSGTVNVPEALAADLASDAKTVIQGNSYYIVVSAIADSSGNYTSSIASPSSPVTAGKAAPYAAEILTSGNQSLDIPGSVPLTHTVNDQYGIAMAPQPAVTYSIVEKVSGQPVPGVSVTGSSLSITSQAAETILDTTGKVFTVTATLDSDSSIFTTFELTVKRAASLPTTLKLFRDGAELGAADSVTIPLTGTESVVYSAKVFDQYNAEMSRTFSWSISPAVGAGVTFVNGSLSVDDTAASAVHTITAKDSAEASITASVTVTLTRLQVEWDNYVAAQNSITYGQPNSAAVSLTSADSAVATVGQATVTGKLSVKNADTLQGAGSRTVTVVFTADNTPENGAYAGATVENSYTVTILQKQLSNDMFTAEVTTKPYTGLPITFPISGYDSDLGAALVEGTDYTLSYSSNINAGAVELSIIPKGNYTSGTAISFTFEILKATPVLSDVTAAPIADGQTLSESTITGTAKNGSATVPGSWAWTNPDTMPVVSSATIPAGKVLYEATFTPNGADAANYNTVTLELPLDVSASVLWSVDGFLAEEDTGVAYGSIPVFDLIGGTAKADDADYSYAFLGWIDEDDASGGKTVYYTSLDTDAQEYVNAQAGYTYAPIPQVTKSVTYTAMYKRDAKPVMPTTATVTFYDETGTNVLGSTTVSLGNTATDDSILPPLKAEDDAAVYVFDGWVTAPGGDTEANLTNISADFSVYAKFQAIAKHTVTFRNFDGSLLQKVTVLHDDIAEYTGTAPRRIADAEYSYAFGGWVTSEGGSAAADLSAVSASMEVYASYAATPVRYTIILSNSLLQATYEYQYIYGEALNFSDDPDHSDSGYNYSFAGWNTKADGTGESSVGATVTGNAIYYAVYDKSPNTYTVTWVVEGDSLETDLNVPFGATPSYDKVTPTKAGYTFMGWLSSHFPVIFHPSSTLPAVTDDVTYTAVFTLGNICTITFKDYDGSILALISVEEGATPFSPTFPVRAADTVNLYDFIGWDDGTDTHFPYALPAATASATYTAVYASSPRSYNVSWINGGNIEYQDTLAFGEIPAYTGTPEKYDSENRYVYTFKGWQSSGRFYPVGEALPAVTADVSYVAVYNEAPAKYTLNIHYSFYYGGEAATTHTESLGCGESFSVNSPAVEGYSPINATISGVMGNANQDIYVLYTKNSYTLTVNFLYDEDNAVNNSGAPFSAYTAQVPYGEAYYVDAPDLTGYSYDPYVDGIMPAEDLTLNITYTAKKCKVILYSLRDSTGMDMDETEYNNAFAAISPALSKTEDTFDNYGARYYQTYEYGQELALPDLGEGFCGWQGAPFIMPDIGGDDLYLYGAFSEYEFGKIKYVCRVLDEQGNFLDANMYTYYDFMPNSGVENRLITAFNNSNPFLLLGSFKNSVGMLNARSAGNTVYRDAVATVNKFPLDITYYLPGGNTIYSEQLPYGSLYEIPSPEISGYTANIPVVSGTMGYGAGADVYYSLNDYRLTINYIYADGSIAGSSVVNEVAYNDTYSIASPAITGYTPSHATVYGRMPARDLTVTVIFTAYEMPLTIYYLYADSHNVAASPHTKDYSVGELYSVESPEVTGYTADIDLVSGRMPASGESRTVTYSPNIYTLTVEYKYSTGAPIPDGDYNGLSISGGKYVVSGRYGTAYSVKSPVLSGYNVDKSVVSGSFEGDVSVTVTYTTPAGGGVTGGGSPDPVEVETPENGNVTVSPSNPSKGDEVTVTVKPDEGYELDELNITDKNGNELDYTDNGDGSYSFTYGGSPVIIEAIFVPLGELPDELPFDDIEGHWALESILEAYRLGLMNGTGGNKFSPEESTSRAMVVTVLWRLAGSPDAESASPFTDLTQDWYKTAVAWAYASGVAIGITDTLFAPDADVTREQLVAFLYRYSEFMGYDVTARAELGDYTDAGEISPYAVDYMRWAVATGIIVGRSETSLAPGEGATRAELATVLVRFYALIKK